MTNLRFANKLVWLNGGLPLLLLVIDAATHRLGADPTNFAIRTTGMCAMIFLSLSLLVTPLRVLTGWNDVIVFRRTLGLYGFYYAAAHFLTYFIFDQVHNVSATAHEIFTKRYLQIGFIALLVLIPLAITSNGTMIRKMGGTKWHALHRLAYVAIIGGVIHFWMQVKSDLTLPKLFAWTTGALLAFRYVMMFVGPKKQSRTVTTPQPNAAPLSLAKKRFWHGELKVARVFEETPTVRTFRLTTLDGSPLPFDYMPGQYMNLALMVDGKRVNRSYTIASSPSRTGNVEMTIKRESLGVGSRHLHDRIKEGDIIKVSAPAGMFTFTGTESKHIVLIAAGVGITPLMSVIRYLTDTAWSGPIDLIFSAKTEEEIIFRNEFQTLAQRFPNFHPTFTLTQPSEQWTGERGRISIDLLKHVVPTLTADMLFHICGPGPMMDDVCRMLKQIGASDAQIKTEKFESRVAANEMPDDAVPAVDTLPVETTSTATAQSTGGEPSITFAKSGKTVAGHDDYTVLELGYDSDVIIPSDCRGGICGTCKIKKLAGTVVMAERDALSVEEEAAGYILACQAIPQDAVSVDC